MGWIIHLVADEFPDDGQGIDDPSWIEYGIERGWSLLTQDERIRRQVAVLRSIQDAGAVIHCLSSAQLSVAAKVERFHTHRAKILCNIRKGVPGFYIVYEDGPRRVWP